MERLCAFQWDMQYPKHTPGAAARQPIESLEAVIHSALVHRNSIFNLKGCL